MHKRFIATLLTIPLATSCAYAQESTTAPVVKISGFGTGALTWTNTDEARFARPNQATGVGTHARSGVDSNLGLQANVQVNSWLSGTVQGLVSKDAEDEFGADLAWAFAKFRLSDQVSVRVGRMGLPAFMISDYRNVGYASTWVRAPAEVYSQVPLSAVDGIDATWQRAFGDTNLTAQLAYGRTSAKLANGGGPVFHVDVTSLVALNIVAERGPLTLRFGRVDGIMTVSDAAPLNGLLGGLRFAGATYGIAGLAPLADAVSLQHKKASFTSLGLGLDWKGILAQSEYAKRKTDGYMNDTTSWYLMGGYRIGKFLPYAIHADLRRDSSVANTIPAACPAGSDPACTPTLQALSAGMDMLNSSPVQGQQSTDSIGLRWDFHNSASLKVQVDRVTPKHGQGLFLTPAASFSGPVTVGAVAVDFVF